MMKKSIAVAIVALFSLGLITSSGTAFAQAATPAKPATPSVKSEKAAKEKKTEGNKGLKKGSDQGKKVGQTKKAS